MWWTKNTKPKPLLEIDEEQGDINAAQKVRNICSFASDSAEFVASYIDRFEDKYKKYQQTRYESAKQRALETSLKMHDPDLRELFAARCHRTVPKSKRFEDCNGIDVCHPK